MVKHFGSIAIILGLFLSSAFATVELDGDANDAIDISKGGTNSQTASGARTSLDVYSTGEADTAHVEVTGDTMSGDLGLGSNDLTDVNSIQFDLTPSDCTSEEGKECWNAEDGTINVGLPGGEVVGQMFQELHVPNRPKNVTGGILSNGSVVLITGGTGSVMQIECADASTEILSANTLGITTEDIGVGQRGYVTTNGLVRGTTLQLIDTSLEISGTTVFLSETACEWTTTKPASPAHAVILGQIGRVHATEGEIYVQIRNGWELFELHDVSDALAAPPDGIFTAWDDVAKVWEGTAGFTYDDSDGSIAHQNPTDSATGFSILDADGGTPILNVDTINEEVEVSGGGLKLVGTGRVERFVESLAVTGFGGSTPTARILEAPYLSYTFNVGDDSHQSFEVPYFMDFTDTASLKVHWYTSVDQTDDEVRFQITWNAVTENGGEVINGGGTAAASADTSCPTQWHILETVIGTISGGSISESDIMGIDLERIAIVDGTNPSLNSIHVLSIEFEFFMDRLGEPL